MLNLEIQSIQYQTKQEKLKLKQIRERPFADWDRALESIINSPISEDLTIKEPTWKGLNKERASSQCKIDTSFGIKKMDDHSMKMNNTNNQMLKREKLVRKMIKVQLSRRKPLPKSSTTKHVQLHDEMEIERIKFKRNQIFDGTAEILSPHKKTASIEVVRANSICLPKTPRRSNFIFT